VKGHSTLTSMQTTDTGWKERRRKKKKKKKKKRDHLIFHTQFSSLPNIWGGKKKGEGKKREGKKRIFVSYCSSFHNNPS